MKSLHPLTLALTFISIFSMSAYGDEATDRATLKSKSYVLKSSSGLCHTSNSDAYETIKLRVSDSNANVDAGKYSNAYKSLDSCIDSGGRYTKAYLSKLKQEDSEAAEEAIISQDNSAYADDQLYGMNFGIGLSFVFLNDTIVEEVSIHSEEISIDKEYSNRAVVMLESHYMFDAKYLGHGPFISVGVASDDGVDPLSTFGGGWMLSFGRKKSNPWNIGTGFYLQNNAKVLRDDLADGDMTQETDITYLTKQRDVWGMMLMFSTTL